MNLSVKIDDGHASATSLFKQRIRRLFNRRIDSETRKYDEEDSCGLRVKLKKPCTSSLKKYADRYSLAESRVVRNKSHTQLVGSSTNVDECFSSGGVPSRGSLLGALS